MNTLSFKALFFAVLIGFLGIFGTYYLSLQVSVQLKEESYLKLENIAKQVSIRFQDSIDIAENDLQALQAFYGASSTLSSKNEFNRYMNILKIDNRNHIQALSWVPSIKKNERASFMTKIKMQYPEFIIKARNAEGNLTISKTKESYTPVTHISPYNTNKAAQGFDLSSSSTRRSSLEYARDSGKMTTTAKITLVQEKEDSYGFLIIAPVYKPNMLTTNEQERRTALSGYVTGVFRINNLMENAKKQADKEGLLLTLFDLDKNNGGLLYGKEQKNSAFNFDLKVPDRNWQLGIKLNKKLRDSIESPSIINWILGSGFLISILLTFSLYALQISIVRARRINTLKEELQIQNSQLEETVAQRTKELVQNNKQLQEHVDELIEKEKVLTDLIDQVNLSKVITDIHTRDLARSNQDLDDFAYVASHDLKAPLRGIDQLASWIAEDIDEGNISDIPEHVRLMRSRVQRLECLLNDLLEYSRANRVTYKLKKVNCSQLINDSFELLTPPVGFSLIIENELPEFLTLSAPFEQVIRNLLNNAFKHHDKSEGKIKVRLYDDNNFYRFSFTDDGPGIDVKYHKDIFKMFKTLKPRDETEGSGMGLALIKKIVEYYTGSVYVESTVGKGSTFYFTWPKEIENIDNVVTNIK
jgi:signal transduction histidine kinase